MKKLFVCLAKIQGPTQVNCCYKTSTTLLQHIGIVLKKILMAFLTPNSNENILTHFLILVQIGIF